MLFEVIQHYLDYLTTSFDVFCLLRGRDCRCELRGARNMRADLLGRSAAGWVSKPALNWLAAKMQAEQPELNEHC